MSEETPERVPSIEERLRVIEEGMTALLPAVKGMTHAMERAQRALDQAGERLRDMVNAFERHTADWPDEDEYTAGQGDEQLEPLTRDPSPTWLFNASLRAILLERMAQADAQPVATDVRLFVMLSPLKFALDGPKTTVGELFPIRIHPATDWNPEDGIRLVMRPPGERDFPETPDCVLDLQRVQPVTLGPFDGATMVYGLLIVRYAGNLHDSRPLVYIGEHLPRMMALGERMHVTLGTVIRLD